MTKIIELIYTEDRRGLGTEEDPVRMIPQLFTKDGVLIAEEDNFDAVKDVFTKSKRSCRRII